MQNPGFTEFSQSLSVTFTLSVKVSKSSFWFLSCFLKDCPRATSPHWESVACTVRLGKHKEKHSVTGSGSRQWSHFSYSAQSPSVTLSPYHLLNCTKQHLHGGVCDGPQNAQVESFDTCPVSLRVPSSHTPYLFLCPRLKMYCSGSIITFSHAQWQPSLSNMAVTVSCGRACACRCLAALHSTPLSPANACESPCPLMHDEP